MQSSTLSATPEAVVVLSPPDLLLPEPPEAPRRVPPAPTSQAMSPADSRTRIINMLAVIVPFVGLFSAMWLCWGGAFDGVQFGIHLFMSLSTSIGVTVGFHRLVTHRSFATSPILRYIFAAFGSMAIQGPVIEWAGNHRRHHQHSDGEDDPHSPHMHAGGSWGTGFRATLRGLYHAHFGWLFVGHHKGLGRYTRDLSSDPVLAAVNRQFPLWAVGGLIAPAIAAGLITGTFKGALLGFLWGGLVRVLVVHHVTWSVNSICHIWGASPFRTGDESRNNPFVGILALGEGWHNNHHAFPSSARHGFKWWQIDISYMLIRTMALVGLARKIRLPDPERLRAKLRGSPDQAPAMLADD